MLVRQALEHQLAVLVEKVELTLLNHFFETAIKLATLLEGPLNVGTVLLADLLDGLINELVLHCDEDLDERPVRPGEGQSAASVDIAPHNILIQDDVIELSGRAIRNLVRKLATLRLDDDSLTRLDAIDLRILALVETVVDAAVVVVDFFLVLVQRILLLDQTLRRRAMLALLLQVNVAIKRFDDSGQLCRGAAAAVDHLLSEPVELTLDRFGLLAQDTTAHSISAGAAELVIQMCRPGRLAWGVVDSRFVDDAVFTYFVLHQPRDGEPLWLHRHRR